MVEDINKEQFTKNVLEANGPVLVQLWAPWCGPCQEFKPVINSIAAEYEDILPAMRINIDEELDLVKELNVMDIPTVIVFNQGKQEKVIVGAHGREEMVKHLSGYIGR
jgi:thioredoxin 1